MMSINQAKSEAAFILANAEKFQPKNNGEWNFWLRVNASRITATALEMMDQEFTEFKAARGIQ